MCRVYDVTREGFYTWKRRGRSLRSFEDEQLYDVILKLFQNSGELYGSPKITEQMRALGYRIGKKRVARIMQENGLIARRATIYRKMPGLCHFIAATPKLDLEQRATTVNKVWVGDITYLKVAEEWRYLAVVMDRFSRRIVGWALGKDRTAKLSWAAFKAALGERKPEPGLIYHTDRGIEYRAYSFAERLAKRGILQSMNRPRRMNDNAFMESFFANFKAERIHKRREFETERELRKVIEDYMDFYNHQRSHSSIGYMAPVEYEDRMS